MTCIVGLVSRDENHRATVWIGGDSAGNDGTDLCVRADEKVFVNGAYIMGFCGSFRMGQLLRYAFTPPAPKTKDLMRFMATKFIDAVRQCLTDGGMAEKHNNVELIEGAFLVGVRGRLFCVDGDYQVGESDQPYVAIGCGAQVANGALYAQPKTMNPKQRVIQALAAAERFSGGVRAPFRVVTLKP